MTNIDLAATVMDQGRVSVNEAIEGDVGYVACSESSAILTLPKEREDHELLSLLRVGESGTRYEGGKAGSKQRQDGMPVHAVGRLDLAFGLGESLSEKAVMTSVGLSVAAQSGRKALGMEFGDSKVVRDKLDRVLHSR